MNRLAGRLVVVTGASRGIGLATARALAAEGATVVRLARTEPPGDAGPGHDLRCDLARPEDAERAAAAILDRFGPPAVLVNNAGRFVLLPFEATTTAELDAHYAINVRAPFALTRALAPAMRQAGGGLVVSVGSSCDHIGYPDNSAYTATKFGLRGLHEALAAEYAGSGLRFTLVSPGSVDTDVWDPIDPDHRPGFTPRARMLRPADVADAVVFAATRPDTVTIPWLRLTPTGVVETT
jgi:NAD(P)-dependent dehydrogenase (short-subunit alcohol dehydrogenase family)